MQGGELPLDVSENWLSDVNAGSMVSGEFASSSGLSFLFYPSPPVRVLPSVEMVVGGIRPSPTKCWYEVVCLLDSRYDDPSVGDQNLLNMAS